MKKSLFPFTMLFVLLLLVACGTESGDNNTKQPGNSVKTTKIDESEVTEGDFTYRLFVNNIENHAVEIQAELEYIGELDEITISHAASPFYFYMKELERGYDIPFQMNEPHIITTLKKGVPIIETFRGSGGYSEEDDQDYIDFMKQMMSGHFPQGVYELNGTATFHDDINDQEYNIPGQLRFTVE